MIGAMPAVALRHERRHNRPVRPSLLYLQSSHSQSCDPSPMLTPGNADVEIYILGVISLLHVSVVTMLIGTITLIVGLAQLKPGADISEYRYVIIGSGLTIIVVGMLIAAIRYFMLPVVTKKKEKRRSIAETHARLTAAANNANNNKAESRSLKANNDSTFANSSPKAVTVPHSPKRSSSYECVSSAV